MKQISLIKTLKITLVAAMLVLSVLISSGQAQDKEEVIKVDTVLLNLPVIVGDRQGRYISNLKKEDFTVTQNGRKQEVEFFAGSEVPMNVAIVLDLSGSTKIVLDDIKKAALEFVKVLRPEDKCMIAGFATEMKVFSKFTSDRKELAEAIKETKIMYPDGSAMYDALYQLQNFYVEPVKGRKAIILLTDGIVGGRRIGDRQLLDTFIEGETLVYPIYFQSPDLKIAFQNSKNTTPEKLEGLLTQYLNALSLASGGRFYAAVSTDFQTAFQNIADELKMQYVVGFYPEKDEKGKMLSRVVVEVNNSDATVRTKRTIKLKSPDKPKL